MKNILKLFTSDMKRLIRNIFAFVIAVGLCILPSLYAWFNIYSNWDPYANTSNIRVAVATDDIIKTVADMRSRGVEFLSTPPQAYYDAIPERLKDHMSKF